MKEIGKFLWSQIIEANGEDYIKSFVHNRADKLKDLILEQDPKKLFKDIKDNLMSNFNKKIGEKANFKEPIFIQFDKKLVKNMIEKIFQEENINEEITDKCKYDLVNFNIENNNTVNILLNGEETKMVDLFLEMISKVFDIEKIENIDKMDEYNINIEFKDHLTKIKKIKIIKYNKKLKIDINENINFIWYIIDEKIQKEIKTNDDNLNILLITKPVIYIGFTSHRRPETEHTFSKSIFSDKNFDDMKYHIMDSFILDNIQNKIDKEIFMKLIKKSLLFLLIKENQIQIQNIINDIYDATFPTMRFLFGNSIQNLITFNLQITPVIFQKFLFKEKALPDYVMKIYVILLGEYRKYLESKRNTYFEEFLSNNESLYKNENDKVKKEICEIMIKYINEKIYEKNNNNVKKGEKEQKTEKEKTKEKKNKIEKMSEINSIGEDDINTKIRIKFDDYLLKNSSIFINELIINTIKDRKIEIYNNKIMKYYFGIYKNDLILSEKDKINN